MKLLLAVLSCLMTGISAKGQIISAQAIIDKCINVHGGESYQSTNFAFDFRKYSYEYHYDKGKFTYKRINSEENIIDILSNDGFERRNNNNLVNLSEKDESKYSNSVNSVIYFAILPFFLNDEAVNKQLLGETVIKDIKYYKIKVTFKKEGGGDDHDDIYIYWISKEHFTMDYLAYSFHVNGGGVRFREAFNRRKIAGITFQDYINYKHDKQTPVQELDKYYEKGELIELSRIELINVRSLD